MCRRTGGDLRRADPQSGCAAQARGAGGADDPFAAGGRSGRPGDSAGSRRGTGGDPGAGSARGADRGSDLPVCGADSEGGGACRRRGTALSDGGRRGASRGARDHELLPRRRTCFSRCRFSREVDLFGRIAEISPLSGINSRANDAKNVRMEKMFENY